MSIKTEILTAAYPEKYPMLMRKINSTEIVYAIRLSPRISETTFVGVQLFPKSTDRESFLDLSMYEPYLGRITLSNE